MGNKKHLIAVVILIAIATVGVYLLLRAIYTLPVAASAEAAVIDYMFNIYFWLIAFFFTFIMVFILYAGFAFRRQPDDEEDGPHVHGHTILEIAWTVIPTVIVVALAVWGAVTFNSLVSAKEGEMMIKVTGQQWSWSFAYPEQGDFVSARLVLPVNQPILLEMEAADVLHSFWVPEFRVKQDLLPGRTTTLRFEPTTIGTFRLICAEICGLQHTTMQAEVNVVSQEDFDAWVEERQSAPQVAEMTQEERGELWASTEGGFNCIGCHSIDGSAKAGPTWLGIYLDEESLTDGTTVVVDEEYLHTSILAPNEAIVEGFAPNLMPGDFETQFAEREAELLATEGLEIDIVEDLITYIISLDE